MKMENTSHQNNVKGTLQNFLNVFSLILNLIINNWKTSDAEIYLNRIGGARQEIERLENELKMVSYQITKGDQLGELMNTTFKSIEDVTDMHQMTNTQLKKIIDKIEVDKDGNVDIYLKLLGDLGLDETILIEDPTEAEGTETVQNNHDYT